MHESNCSIGKNKNYGANSEATLNYYNEVLK
jgi:hypothetical protein